MAIGTVKVLVTGANGLVGHALRSLASSSPHHFFFIGRQEADLTKEEEVNSVFEEIKPHWVIHTAAKVGGIGGNLIGPADYFRDNILMNTHVIHHAYKVGVTKLFAFSSVCVFPDGIPVLREGLIHDGLPYQANFAYAHAKRMIDIQIQAYQQQYGVTNYSSVIFGNLFGENDLYNLTHGHVLPSLMHKIYLAKKDKKPLRVWGNGEARREFLYSMDAAKIILSLLDKDEISDRILVSGAQQFTIKEIVSKLCEAAGFSGEVIWETDKPSGQHARPTDLSLLRSLVNFEYTDLDLALKQSYQWFEQNYQVARK